MSEHLQNSESAKEHYKLHLYVAGASGNSLRAIANLNAICEAHLTGRYSLDVIDVHQQKDLAEREQIIALPMLLKIEPLPPRRLIGDMSDTKKVLSALSIAFMPE